MGNLKSPIIPKESIMNFQEIFGENWHKLANNQTLANFETSTDIQTQSIPQILAGRDIFIQSPTGSGKTLAYLLPIFTMLKSDVKSTQAIVIAPTYELAAQIATVARNLFEHNEDVALLIGGADKRRQQTALKSKPKIVVGTLGRICEFIADKKLSVHYVRTLVFDEADRLFIPENMPQIQGLTKSVLRDTQIALASATMPQKTVELAAPLMKDPAEIKLGSKIPKNIKHYFVITDGRKKSERLRNLIHSQNIQKALIFVNMSYAIDKITTALNHHNIPAKSLQSAQTTADKMARKAAITALRDGKIRTLVSTDAGSRGLDIEDLTHVINLDIPAREKDYLHRVGRCGRAGADGIVLNIVTEGEATTLKKMAKKLGIFIHNYKKIEKTPK